MGLFTHSLNHINIVLVIGFSVYGALEMTFDDRKVSSGHGVLVNVSDYCSVLFHRAYAHSKQKHIESGRQTNMCYFVLAHTISAYIGSNMTTPFHNTVGAYLNGEREREM